MRPLACRRDIARRRCNLYRSFRPGYVPRSPSGPCAMLEHFPATLALIGIVVLVSSLLSGWVERTGLPQVAIFLLLGLVLGPLGVGVLDLTLRSASLQV